MTYTEHRITLDIHKTVTPVSLSVKKGDTGRRLLVNLAEKGYPYHISEGCYAAFTAKKPDGHIIHNECTIDGCTIIYDFTVQTAVVAGQLDCEIKLYGSDGELITSPSFTIIVEDTVYDEGDVVESTDEFSALAGLIAEATGLNAELAQQIDETKTLKREVEELNAELEETLETRIFELDNTLAIDGAAADAKATGDAIEKLKERTQEAVTTLQGGITAVATNLDKRASAIEQEIADLKYVEIEITSISNDVGTVEMGTTVKAVTVSWKLNKEPVSQTVNGEAVEATARSKALTGLNITTGTYFPVTVTDERGATDTGRTSVKFLNGVYYGALEYGAAIDSAAILGLTRKLQGDNVVSFTVTPGEGKRPAYACPTRYGTPTFVIGGFAYEWEKVSTFDFTNASGYTESYDVWMHGQDVSDSITINVT